MTEKNKPETQTNTESTFKLQKIYLLARNPEGLIMPMDYSLPLTDMAKSSILNAIDDGFAIKEIKEAEHQALVTATEAEKKSWPAPSDADLAAIKKLVDYEPPHRLERKLRAAVYAQITGTVLSDGDADQEPINVTPPKPQSEQGKVSSLNDEV